MGLYRRGQVWWMDLTYNSKRIRRSLETSDRRLAERIYAKVITEIIEGKYFERLPGDHKTFREMIERYLREYTVKKAPGTQGMERALAKRLIEYFGNFALTQITPRLIVGYKGKRIESGASAQTINHELQLMSHAYKMAEREWEWVKDNPVRKVSKERIDNFVERWLTYEEEEKLLDASPEWLKDIIVFALNTGLRQSEILNLKWKDVNLFRKTITILEQKNNSIDTLPLNQKALTILKAKSRVRYLKCEYVFHSKNKTRIDRRNLLRAFYSAVRKSGIEPLRFHDLRHTFSTRLVQSGVDIYTVQKLCRWKNISMAMRYAHHYPESLRSGVEALDSITILS